MGKVSWTGFPLKVNVEFGSFYFCLSCLLKFLQHCEVIMLNNHAKFLVCICKNNSIRCVLCVLSYVQHYLIAICSNSLFKSNVIYFTSKQNSLNET
jgi:hypothetical protein